jgi:cytochrome c oxidase subunit 2
MRDRPLLQLALIGIFASLVGVGLGLLIDWFPEQGSEEAAPIDTLYDVLLAASIPIFVFVMTVAIYSVIRFRARPGDTGDGAPIHGNAKLEVFWVTVPFLLVTALAIYGWVVLVDIEEPQPDAMVVEVRGEQFAWSFAYPGEEGEPPVQTTDLMLPVDRQVDFEIQTQDVIHSFWVPAFRLKSDTVPGITTRVRVTPTEEGEFDIVCAELCGIGHSTMRQSVTVVPEDEFTAWLTDQQEALAAEDGGAPAEGQSPSGLAAQAAAAAAEPEEPAPAGDAGGAGGEESGAQDGGEPEAQGGGGAAPQGGGGSQPSQEGSGGGSSGGAGGGSGDA